MSSWRRIGVVGFSRETFDHEAARAHLRRFVSDLLARERGPDKPLPVIVSGWTNQGVPRLAYELARELGLGTVGISARAALRARAGRFPVDESIVVGERYGDESEAFIAYIDVLIRVGGGPQSRREVALFEEKHGHDPDALRDRLFQAEVAWFGR